MGQLAASGSYWIPARIDLDTLLSKIDSRIVDDVIVINSFSKYFGMTGWRLGWIVAPAAAISEMEKLAQNLFLAFVIDGIALEAVGANRSNCLEFITGTENVLAGLNRA